MTTVQALTQALRITEAEAEMVLTLWGRQKQQELLSERTLVLPGLAELKLDLNGLQMWPTDTAKQLLQVE